MDDEENAMTHNARAVLCREVGKPVVVEEIAVAAPRRGEALVKIAACGVCHSDLSATNGTIQMQTPLVLGHEAAGIVAAVGEGVTDLALGDHVVSSFVNMCGRCRWCTTGKPHLCDMAAKTLYTLPDGTTPARDRSGQPVYVFSACGVMAEYATLSIDNLVKIDKDVPLDRAALVSCGVMTGVGAVFNTARVEPGTAVMVIGTGGVGLNVIQGAAIAGANPIVAVDVAEGKLDLARRFGATHVINAAAEENLPRAAKKLTGGGPDYCFECIGLPKTIDQAFRSLRKGGTAVVVGVARGDESVAVRPVALTFEEKTLTGSYFGSARPREDFPRLLALYRAGRLKLDELITRRYRIEEAPQAFADLEAGKNARGVIVFD
jgi:S-(hydroxymethyl)glutathione dehydrogenase/alcohol dehydrogenase